ncbi:unnamed protein product [Caenorhabditis auriculariae]|uniref:Uncharacterized protein n=1 Tax=Caenorhabditis auriculariae TaxID=2777116 RepID=A0A8S1GP31_9PELO|nr:unnamed protein product [Caenorhabditis auriculariae]
MSASRTGTVNSAATDDRRSVVSCNSSTASTLVADSVVSSKTAASQLRKFTAGVGRPGLAREAREAVRTVLVTQNPLRKPPLSYPVDYEKFITERSIQLENDPQREIILFPRDDIEVTSSSQDQSTATPMVHEADISRSKWLLTREALRFFICSHRSIIFNYSKFSGDYAMGNESSVESETLSSLVFESDMALEEERAAYQGGFFAPGSIKEGYLMIVKTDSTLFDNLKSGKKRFCVLKKHEGGDLTFEVRKAPNDVPKQTPMKVAGAQIKSTKKGKTVLEIEPYREEKDLNTSNNTATSAHDRKALMVACEDQEELEDWLTALQTAIAFSNKEDTLSTCSETPEKSSKQTLDGSNSLGRGSAPDAESIGSQDSGSFREVSNWRGRNTAARALQPPIVGRRNIFSLFYRLQPIAETKLDAMTTMLHSRARNSRSSTSPTRSRRNASPLRRRTSLISAVQPSKPPTCVSVDFRALMFRLPVLSGVLQQIEPFFVRIFVFDTHECRRVSEEFQLLVNGEDLHVSAPVFDNSMEVNGVRRSLLVDRAASKALMNIANPHKDVWLVCRIDRVLSGDTSGDLYMKATGDGKTTSKLQKVIAGSITRLSGYRQKFAWAARPLFPDLRPDAPSPLQPTPAWARGGEVLQCYRCEANRLSDSDLQRYLSDFSKVEKAYKFIIPSGLISLSIDLKANVSDFPQRLNPSLYPLKPWNRALESDVPPVFQLQIFGEPANQPHSELFNLLYIYPLSLKYDNQKAFSKARNIACSVRFVKGDETIPEKAIVDRLSASGPHTIHTTCAVQHHQQCPIFGDEIKVQLPLNLSTSDHLLFSFSHISVAGNTSVKTPEATETPVGYAWLPLVWKKDRLVLESDEQEFALPVAVDLPAHYYKSKPNPLGKGDDNEIRWVDQKPLFRVRLRLVSSVFTTDGKLQSFFQACDRLSSRGFVGDALGSLKRRERDSKSKSSTPSSIAIAAASAIADGPSTDARSCSPIAEANMSRSPSHESDYVIKHLVEKIQSLCDVSFERLIVFLPIVLGRLFAILPRAPADLAIATLNSIVSISDKCTEKRMSHVVRKFVRYYFVAIAEDGRCVGDSIHAAICRTLPTLLRESQSNIEVLTVLYRQLWLLTDAIIKSMAQTICSGQLNKVAQRDRFPAELLEQMGQVLEVGVPQMLAKHREIPEECRCANLAFSYFVRFSLSFVDRGTVFKWIHFYISRLDDSDFKVLREYKADFLTILCMHEHFLPLNLPVLINSQNHIQRVTYLTGIIEQQQTTNPSGAGFLSRFFNQIFNTPSLETTETDRYSSCAGEWHLTSSYSSYHFIVGLVFQELVACLREPKDYRKRPITLLRNLLAKHSFDRRYSDMNIQRRIALIYAPLLDFALDHLPDMEGNQYDETDAVPIGMRSQYKWRSLDRPLLPPNSANGALMRASPARQTNSSVTTSRHPPVPPPLPPSTTPSKQTAPQQHTPLAEKLDDEELQDLLICTLYVIQRIPKRIFAAIWSENEGGNSERLIRLLDVVLEIFRYRGKEQALRRTAASSKTRNLTVEPPSRNASSFISATRASVDRSGGENGPVSAIGDDDAAIPFRVLQLVNLSQEAALIILDAAQTFAHQLAIQYSRWQHAETLFVQLLFIHLKLLDENWSEAVRLHAIAALALFVNLFRSRLFEGGPLEALYILIEKVLLQMASRLPSVQTAAAALLQLILRNGYEVAEGYFATQALAQSVSPNVRKVSRKVVTSERLGRPGAQTGVALARLLGFQSVLSNSVQFERGLAAVEALVDSRKATSFDLAVLDLLRQLRGVMSATVALKDAARDAIRLADLHLQLADSYRGSAALRSAWFDTLAEIYERDRWFAEAAVCYTHSVAIIAKELEEKGDLEVDWRIFDWINAEVSMAENCRHDGSVQPGGFTPENLASKIDKTSAMLTLAERFEAVGPLYRLLIPLLEKNMNFTSLVSVYAELQQTYSRAAEVRTSGKRHLGTYFRVRFYGETHFGNEHGTDWVYREIGLTSLATFVLKMKEQCQRALGHDRVQIEANRLDLTKLDPSYAYVQVIHVDPVAVIEQKEKTDFWRHTNISEFSFEFAMLEDNAKKISGEPSISEQVLNKTIIKVSGVFPATRRRLPVVSESNQIFSPLEFACQKLLVKSNQILKTLSAAENGRNLDIKGLQLLLQGAVMPTVNAGPLVYAEAFTKEDQIERYGQKGIEELKNAFRSLMAACQAAILANESAIGADQQTYHEVLVASFDAMHERLQSFFGVSLRAVVETERTAIPPSAMHILDSIGGNLMKTNSETINAHSGIYLQLLREQYLALQSKYAFMKKNYDLITAGSSNESHTDGLASRLVSTVASLCDSEDFSDLQFHVGNRSIPAHRIVVAARTSFWSDLTSIEKIVINETDFETFHIIYRWMYTDEVNVKINDDHLLKVCEASIRFHLMALQESCVEELSARLDIHNCVPIYEFAEKKALTVLRDTCAAMVAARWKEFTPDSFRSMAAPILFRLLASNSKHMLHTIVEIGREDVLFLYFMENMANINYLVDQTDDNGTSPLELAILCRRFSTDEEHSREGGSGIASQLVEKGANPNAEDSDGNSLLDRMVKQGDSEACEFLKNHGADVGWRHSSDGHGLLHTAARRSNEATPSFVEWIAANSSAMGVNLQDSLQRTPLSIAAAQGNGDIVDVLLAAEVDVNIATSSGETALSLALFGREAEKAGRQDLQIAERLCAAGADVNARVNDVPLLHLAVKLSDGEAVRFLLSHGCDVNSTTFGNSTVLHEVARNGEEEILQTIVRSSKNIEWTRDNENNTALHIALSKGNLTCARFLIQAGAPIDQPDSTGEMPLVRAIRSAREDVAMFLLGLGAEHDTRGVDGKTCLESAAELGLSETLKKMLSSGAPVNQRSSSGFTVLERALRNGHIACAAVLTSYGCDVESRVRLLVDGKMVPVRDPSRDEPPFKCELTLLHSLLDDGLQEPAIFLIQEGCDVNVSKRFLVEAEDDQQTPAHMAVSKGLDDVLAALVQRGVSLDVQDSEGRTPLHIAVRQRNPSAVNVLLQAPDVSFVGIRDKLGLTPLSQAMINRDHKIAAAIVERQPHAAEQMNGAGENLLHSAIRTNKLENVLFLLGVGRADPTRLTNDGTQRSPLHLAATADDEMIIRTLILAGCDVNTRMNNDMTPLHEALRSRHAANACILLENGADPNLLDDIGENALHYAVRSGSLECIRAVLDDGRCQRRRLNQAGQTTLHICATLTLERLPNRTTSAELAEVLLNFEEKIVSKNVSTSAVKELENFIDARDADGSTALFISYSHGNSALCRALLRRGACMGIRNAFGVNVFTYETATKQLLFGLLEWLEQEPRWSDGESCDCGTKFSLTQRKHHCRHCGRHVCSKCSETTMPIVKYGEEKRVRVCDLCAFVLSGRRP